jgi:hypothetical protein
MLRKCCTFTFVLGVQILLAQDTLRSEIVSAYDRYKESHFQDTAYFNRITSVGSILLEKYPADSTASLYLHLTYYNHAVSLLKMIDEPEDHDRSIDLQNEAMVFFKESEKYYLLYKKKKAP